MLEKLFTDPNWDRPFYKRLANNDTGAAAGHQAGLVVPKDLRKYFPGLNPEANADQPTVDHRIRADLIVGGKFKGRVVTRYQYQTWGRSRSPESRLTDELGPLRNEAAGGDYVVCQRSFADLDLYRLILVRQGTADFDWLTKQRKVGRWGAVFEDKPLSEAELDRSRREQASRELEAFRLFDDEGQKVARQTLQLARSIAFREALLNLYRGQCAACGRGFRYEHLFEIEGAHIVPRARSGTNDARNGIALCRSHHWAFDKGLIGVSDDRRILVPSGAKRFDENLPLQEIEGRQLMAPKAAELAPDQGAIQWHRQNILMR